MQRWPPALVVAESLNLEKELILIMLPMEEVQRVGDARSGGIDFVSFPEKSMEQETVFHFDVLGFRHMAGGTAPHPKE